MSEADIDRYEGLYPIPVEEDEEAIEKNPPQRCIAGTLEGCVLSAQN